MATDESAVSHLEEIVLKRPHFGQCINISFELNQNAITKTQMFFVSWVPFENDYFSASSWCPQGAEEMPGHFEPIFISMFFAQWRRDDTYWISSHGIKLLVYV